MTYEPMPVLEQTFAPAYSIGAIRVDPPVVLAPMADVTNGPFRRLCKRIGAPGLIVTEQISTQAIHYKSARTMQMFDWAEEERPLSVQLFGADPAIMAEAARIVADRGADIIDINMGCWVPKICKQGAGAALLKDEETAARVVHAVVEAVSVPVTVKMRAGWNHASLNSAALARRLEGIGVQAFALHARTAQQGYTGHADWRWIAEIKSAVSAPVVGNGDICSADDAARMLRETGCDGVMIGRAAIGNPWILRQIGYHLRTGDYLPLPTLQERVETAHEHLVSMAASIGEERAVKHLRGQIPQYFKGFRGAPDAREGIVRANTIAEVDAILGMVLERNPE
ncbi:MAG: tRNA dihydrouridine synthase DusB [Armatimonadota bacterium]|nr:tRNA dihydrouridine synthase DusB [Armatimonadota bacterium]